MWMSARRREQGVCSVRGLVSTRRQRGEGPRFKSLAHSLPEPHETPILISMVDGYLATVAMGFISAP